jgi:hypothetical protein
LQVHQKGQARGDPGVQLAGIDIEDQSFDRVAECLGVGVEKTGPPAVVAAWQGLPL